MGRVVVPLVVMVTVMVTVTQAVVTGSNLMCTSAGAVISNGA